MYYEGAERSIDCVGISGREGRWDELSTLPGAEKPQLKFQQDNAPSHRSKSTMKWFKESSIPHKLKKALCALPHLPTTIQELCAAILSVWDTLLIEDVDKHINRMHDRVEALLAAKGGHTRF